MADWRRKIALESWNMLRRTTTRTKTKDRRLMRFLDIVNYQAFLRKQTRFNATRGGKILFVLHLYTHIFWPIINHNKSKSCAIHPQHRLSTQPQILTHHLSRSMALPCTLQDVLAHCPWYDSSQDRPWCRSSGTPKDIRGCPPTI